MIYALARGVPFRFRLDWHRGELDWRRPRTLWRWCQWLSCLASRTESKRTGRWRLVTNVPILLDSDIVNQLASGNSVTI